MRIRIPRAGALALSSLLLLGACAGDEAADSEPAEEPMAEEPAAESAMSAEEGAMEEGAMAEAAEGLLDPGTASAEALTAIEGIDPALADALVAGRPYENMLAVDSVLAGALDAAAREEVYRHLWTPLDLNAASAEEILLIPGVGDRMLHEFEEYRPYRAIEEFRREIGKYVDDEEVARLERYVTIR